MSRSDDDRSASKQSAAHEHLYPFETAVALSGYRNVVTTDAPPPIYLHKELEDRVRVLNGVRHYFIAESGLSGDEDEKARQILEKIALLGDWAAGEIIGRRDRDAERLRTGYFDLKPRLSVPEMLVLRFIRRNPEARLRDVSTPVDIDDTTIGQAVDKLVRMGALEVSHDDGKLWISDA